MIQVRQTWNALTKSHEMIQIDKTKAGSLIACQGDCKGDANRQTKHVQLLLKTHHNADLVEVCTTCEAVLQVNPKTDRLVKIGWLQSIHMERSFFINL